VRWPWDYWPIIVRIATIDGCIVSYIFAGRSRLSWQIFLQGWKWATVIGLLTASLWSKVRAHNQSAYD